MMASHFAVMSDYLLRIRNVGQLVVVCSKGERFKAGADQDVVDVLEDATIIVNNDGVIEDVLPNGSATDKYATATFATDIDGSGKCVLPGLVDGHTHPIWAGDRVHEFAMKLAGASYMEVHKMGGGIGYTVSRTTAASDESLMDSLLHRYDRMLRVGTTTAECKTGYGLEGDTEMRLLKILHSSKAKTPLDIVTTYLGAHSIPKGKTVAEATEDIVNNQIPKIKALRAEGVISPDNIDVFLEKGVFEEEDTKRILRAGVDIGLKANFHGDEIKPMNSGVVAAEVEALAASHLEQVSDKDIELLAATPTVAVLLPTTAYILRLDPPPARKLIAAGVPVALGSDFNPNAHCLSMPFVMHLACVNLRMTMNEALVAATINSAASLDRSNVCGSLERGKFGDMIILQNTDLHMGGDPSLSWQHLIYQLGDPPISTVIKRGAIVYSRTSQ